MSTPQTAVARIADTVRAEVARRRLTQAEVAAVLGLPASSVSKRLAGVVPLTVIDLIALATAWHVSVESLLPADIYTPPALVAA